MLLIIGFCFGMLTNAILVMYFMKRCNPEELDKEEIYKCLKNERNYAFNEKKSMDYINGMSRIIALYNVLTEEVNEDEN